jgi:hypothetical protein
MLKAPPECQANSGCFFYAAWQQNVRAPAEDDFAPRDDFKACEYRVEVRVLPVCVVQLHPGELIFWEKHN